jgi:hypothetical protein
MNDGLGAQYGSVPLAHAMAGMTELLILQLQVQLSMIPSFRENWQTSF